MQSDPPPTFPLARGLAVLWCVLAAVLVALWLAGWRIAAFPLPLSDLTSYFAPRYAYAAERFAHGEIPLWNPLEFCGLPYLAAIELGTLYAPQRLAYALLTGDAAHTAFFFLHILLGSAFSLLLMRSLGCGLWPSVLASAWVVHPSWLAATWDHPNLMAASAWLPLLVFLVRRTAHLPSLRIAAALGVVAATQILTAYPPASVATAYVLLVGLPFWVVETRARRLAWVLAALVLAAIVAVLLAAAQIVPTAELLSFTPRREQSSDMQAMMLQYAENPRVERAMFYEQGLRALHLAGTSTQLWRDFGPVLLALCLAALILKPRAAVWGALAAAVLTSLVPLGWLLRLPLYEFVRWGVEWTYLAPFALYALAGLGWQAILVWRPSWKRWQIAATLVLLGVSVAWNFARVPTQWWTRRNVAPPPLPAAIEQACDPADARFRLLWPTGQMRGGLLARQLRSIGGYEPSLLPDRMTRIIELLGIGSGGTPSPGWQRKLMQRHAVAARMALKCVLVERPTEAFASGGLEPIKGPSGQVEGYLDPNALPRARFASEVVRARSSDEAFHLFAQSTDASGRSVVLDEQAPELSACGASGNAEVEMIQDRPEAARIRVSAPCAGYLVLADAWLPGWEATLDGEAAPIEVADYAFRAVHVPEGVHEVEFRYRPWSVRLGAWLSFAGLAVGVACFAIPSRRDPLRGR